MEDGRTVETYMVGREGVTHATASSAPVHTFSRLAAQASGTARKIEAGKLRQLSTERHGMRTVLTAYAAGLQAELEQSGACNALHRASSVSPNGGCAVMTGWTVTPFTSRRSIWPSCRGPSEPP